ncbi:MAG: hypothetical protein ACREFJ_16465 [Acetobacteraceae bacterium]
MPSSTRRHDGTGAAATLSTLAVLVTLLLLGAAALIARGRNILPWQF